ncbi:ATP-binding cassette domain-containing protein [Streptomyces sp. N2-109]|uniref:ATP-binding cassette domain-containing protein n=1 Tax=Streptomyces gossypii TaxID=2883101 RepID=A0ABT2K207_9ACTN|nr:ATP-binding cassette domain-containing protein [Streptomyces gossypii]MCT2594202.1 ATP-binding cassette domain-containing protein [Streptomyces gossypii]
MAAPPDDDVLWARGLHYTYDGSPALQGVTLGVREREIVSIAGSRGSGKTTLLGCLSGRLLPAGGEVWFDGVPVHTLGLGARERLRRDRFGWIGSEPELVPGLTAWENAALPLLLRGAGHRAARTAAHEWLDRLDIGDCADRRPAHLLQSQRQRVAISRALAHSPAVLFADEPTAPLHQADRLQALRTLTAAARSHGITVVLTSHDPTAASAVVGGPADRFDDSPAATLVDRTITLIDGRRTPPVATAPDPEGSAACSLSA